MATDSGEARPAQAPIRVSAYGWYALFVLVLVYIINFVDRQIISILAQDIKSDLHLQDAQIGFLYGTAFAVFYALFGIPLGRLADSWYRGRLIAIGLTLWSSMTAFSGFATSFGMLATARIGVGIGEASASPAAYSMISDYFPKEKRATALSIYSAGLYIGGGLSLPVGGLISSRWNAAYPIAADAPLGLVGWQVAFLAVGIPGLLLALWVLSLREPQRGASDRLPQPVVRPNAWRDFGLELVAILPPLTLFNAARNPAGLGANLSVLAILIAAGCGLYLLPGGDVPLQLGLGVYAIFTWLQALKHRDIRDLRLNLIVLATLIAAGYGFYRLTGFEPRWAAYAFGVYVIFSFIGYLTLSWIQSLKHRDLGTLRTNVIVLAIVAAAGYGLYRVTGDAPQWAAYGLGVYAVFSWVQSLRHRDPATYCLIWGNRTVVMLAVAFGSISFMTYAISFWAPPFAIRTFYGSADAPAQFIAGLTARDEVATILGWGAAIAAATGVILGGVISDLWRRRDPRGRIFVNMLAVILPVPAVWIMFTTHDLATFYFASPVAQLFGSAWVGAAVASLQDVVLPRMRATAGATYVLGTTMVGLALGPYFAGKMADVTQSLSAGVFWLYVMPPFTLVMLYIGSRRIAGLEETKVERARAAGEPV